MHIETRVVRPSILPAGDAIHPGIDCMVLETIMVVFIGNYDCVVIP